MIDMKLEQADKRGFVFSFKCKDREYLLIYTKAGVIRGGHSHEKEQYNVLLNGSILWNGNLNIAGLGNSIIFTESNKYHIMESATDSLVIEWKE